MESSGSSEWELLSIVDNKQRGSQERMIEKLHYLVEHKQQSISKAESELKSTIILCIVTVVLILYYACISTVGQYLSC